MIGAIIGDVVGSYYEWFNIKTKDFELFTRRCSVTDDSIMTLAICDALMKSMPPHNDLNALAVSSMQKYGREYPYAGYGTRFSAWLEEDLPEPYESWGNGSAMRVSGCAYAANSIDEAIKLSRMVTEVTHNHPEGIKGAEATAVAVYMARTGKTMDEIREHITGKYYPIDFTMDSIRANYSFDVSCQGSVPQAMEAFFESTNFEDAIRNAISIGGDSDTIAAITGSVAEAYYGVPIGIRKQALTFLDDNLRNTLEQFEARYPAKIEPDK